jgi:hypothetical protein
LLFGQYRRGDANDPETYVAAVAAVLSCYSNDTIREATDPRTGISATEKFAAFMPNPGEVKLFCDDLNKPGLEAWAEEYDARSRQQLQERAEREAIGPRVIPQWMWDDLARNGLVKDKNNSFMAPTKPWTRYTDDELRKLYPPKKADDTAA